MNISCSQCNESLYIGEGNLKIKNHGLVMALCNPCLKNYDIEIVDKRNIFKSCGNCGYIQLEISVEPCKTCNQCSNWKREEYISKLSEDSC